MSAAVADRELLARLRALRNKRCGRALWLASVAKATPDNLAARRAAERAMRAFGDADREYDEAVSRRQTR